MKAGDISSSDFARLFLKFKDKYVSIATSYIHDSAAAEDIVAESFTRFWDGRDEIELKGAPEAYIIAIVRNRCLNYLRDKALHEKAGQAMLADIEALENNDFQWLFDDDVEGIFHNFLQALPEERRNIFCASRFEGLTYNEIAIRYGITPRKVKREISAVLDAVRIGLKDYLPR